MIREFTKNQPVIRDPDPPFQTLIVLHRKCVRRVVCIRGRCDLTDEQCGPVIQPLLGGGCQTGLTKRLEIEPRPDPTTPDRRFAVVEADDGASPMAVPHVAYNARGGFRIFKRGWLIPICHQTISVLPQTKQQDCGLDSLNDR